jgi:hypothetical protein
MTLFAKIWATILADRLTCLMFTESNRSSRILVSLIRLPKELSGRIEHGNGGYWSVWLSKGPLGPTKGLLGPGKAMILVHHNSLEQIHCMT